MLAVIAKGAAFTAGSMVVGTLVRPAVQVVEGAAEAASKTVQGVYKAVNLGNNMVIRAADLAELKSASRHEVSRLQLITQQQTALITFGENTEELKARYTQLDDATKTLIDAREARFPKP